MKYIYIITWCIWVIIPNTTEPDKFGRIDYAVTDELNWWKDCHHEKRFGIRADAIQFYNDAIAEGLPGVTIDSCERERVIIYGDTVYLDCENISWSPVQTFQSKQKLQ